MVSKDERPPVGRLPDFTVVVAAAGETVMRGQASRPVAEEVVDAFSLDPTPNPGLRRQPTGSPTLATFVAAPMCSIQHFVVLLVASPTPMAALAA